MKTEDELDAEIAKLFDEVTTTEVEMVNSKPRISDQATLDQRAVSREAREIFKRHTDLFEPLSLDEAYLDVSENKTGLPTATQVARAIREHIRAELALTASAGVAPNKFLAKIASDWRKPDGMFVIRPEEVDLFLLPLAVGRLPGVGKVTEEKLKGFQVQTVADLRALDLSTLRTLLWSLRRAPPRVGSRDR